MAGAPQNSAILWRMEADAPQNSGFLWRMGHVRHRNANSVAHEAMRHRNQKFCGAPSPMRHRIFFKNSSTPTHPPRGSSFQFSKHSKKMLKNSKNKILRDVVRCYCLVRLEILKYEIWPFLQNPEKKRKTATTFAYDVEKMRLIYQKKLEKKRKTTPNSKGKKSYFKMKFFSYKIKKK